VPWKYPVTMQGCLRDSGYLAINIGKTHYYPRRASLGFEINRLYDPQNWLDGEPSDYHAWLSEQTDGKIKDTADSIDNNGFCYIPWTHETYLHPTEWTTETAIEEISKMDGSKPFFMQLGFHRPHPPLDPPTAYYEMYRDVDFGEAPVGDWEPEEYRRATASNAPMIGTKNEEDRQTAIRAYCALITHIDHQVGRLLYYLQRHEHTKNTIIIFTSDHGDLLGDHCTWRKIFPYEGSSKIPLIIRTPDTAISTVNTTHGYRRDRTPVTHMDIMPTILKAAGVPVPSNVEGADIMGPLYGRKIEGREFIHGEHSSGLIGVQFVTDGRYKYCYDTVHGREQLFNLEEDPRELRNLAGLKEYEAEYGLWKRRLVDILAARPVDGLVKDGELVTGVELPSIRKELLKGIDPDEIHIIARKGIERFFGADFFKKN
ncbi:MAG: sulfatase-like hydrolase/transferase, partial [Clostridia bacterium]